LLLAVQLLMQFFKGAVTEVQGTELASYMLVTANSQVM